MSDSEFLRKEAERILNNSPDAASVRQAGDLIQLAAHIDSLEVQILKTQAERLQIVQSLEDAKGNRRTEQLKYWVSQLSPLITVLVLAGTLILQTAQLKDTDRQKEIDRENASWSDAVRAMGGSDKHFAWASIQGYLQSPTHRANAREMAVQIIEESTDIGLFNTVYTATFEPLTFQNLPQVLEIDRTLGQENNTLSNRPSEGLPQSSTDKARVLYTDKVVALISARLSTLLRAPRKGSDLNLSNAFVWDADFSGANFQAANLTGFFADHLNVTGADFRGVRASNSWWKRVAWWRVARIDHTLLDYLVRNFSFDSHVDYGLAVRPTMTQFKDSVTRLRQGSSENAVKQPRNGG